MTQSLSPPLARFLIVVPTVLLSLFLGNLGFAVPWRVALSLGFGALLILFVTLIQRRRSS